MKMLFHFGRHTGDVSVIARNTEPPLRNATRLIVIIISPQSASCGPHFSSMLAKHARHFSHTGRCASRDAVFFILFSLPRLLPYRLAGAARLISP